MFSLLSAAIVLLGAEPAPKEAPTIVGSWHLVKIGQGRKERMIPDGEHKFTFAPDGKVTANNDPKRIETLGYKSSSSKDPAEIDFDTESKSPPMRGIYKIDGDTLTMC